MKAKESYRNYAKIVLSLQANFRDDSKSFRWLNITNNVDNADKESSFDFSITSSKVSFQQLLLYDIPQE